MVIAVQHSRIERELLQRRDRMFEHGRNALVHAGHHGIIGHGEQPLDLLDRFRIELAVGRGLQRHMQALGDLAVLGLLEYLQERLEAVIVEIRVYGKLVPEGFRQFPRIEIAEERPQAFGLFLGKLGLFQKDRFQECLDAP
jgi:hypothetical protein